MQTGNAGALSAEEEEEVGGRERKRSRLLGNAGIS